jgi:hypothetical protein
MATAATSNSQPQSGAKFIASTAKMQKFNQSDSSVKI